MEKRNKGLKLLKILTYGIIIVVIYNILMVHIFRLLNRNGKSIFNYNMFIITTDSMKPWINSGDIVITHKTGEEELAVGDVISFYKYGDIITHRIVEIKEETPSIKSYITKGDNNNVQDRQSIIYNNIIGKQILKIPFIGKIALLMQNNLYVVILIIIILLIYSHIQRIEEKNIKRREKKKKEDEKFQDKA